MAVSVKDVAARAGVSVGTVSNVLNNPQRVNSKTRDRVLRAVRDLGYVPNNAARQLRAGVSTTIGLVVPDITNPFFAQLARGAETAAEDAGLSLLIGSSDGRLDRELAHLDHFEQYRVRGVLLSPVGNVYERLSELRGRGIGGILVDRAAGRIDLSSVAVDDVAGGSLAAGHLFDEGCRHVAFVGPVSAAVRQVDDRWAGAQLAAADRAGVRLTSIESAGLGVADGRLVGAEILRMRPRSRPEGLFTANDLLAVGVLQAFVMNGSVRVPDDIALIGYDDIDFARSAIVPLSSVAQPAGLIGRTAVEVLVDETTHPDAALRHIVFQPELVPRESSRLSRG